MFGIGFIGLGTMGQTMLSGVRTHAQFRPVVGFDPQHVDVPDLPMASSLAQVCVDDAVDVVYIASPPRFHAAAVASCVAAKKPVFCEKPLSANVQEADALCHLVESAQLIAAVNFPFATHAAARQVQHWCAHAVVGAVTQAKLTLRFAAWPRGWQHAAHGWLAQPQDGGYLREVASHFLFLAGRLWGQGEVVHCTVTRQPNGLEDTVRATLRFGSVTLELDAAIAGDAEDYNQLGISGSQGAIYLENWDTCRCGNEVLRSTDWESPQLDALALLLQGKPSPLATFSQARDVVRLVETMLRH